MTQLWAQWKDGFWSNSMKVMLCSSRYGDDVEKYHNIADNVQFVK